MRTFKSARIAMLLVTAAGLAFGQFNSSLRGVITDPSGAPIPNAAVSVKNSNTGVSASVASDQSGNYVLTSLAPGQYEVSVSAAGFTAATVRLTLQTEQSLDLPVKLSVSSGTQTVEVRAEAPLLNTAESRIQATLQTRELESLPLQGRTIFGLISTAPGVTGLGLLTGGAPQSAPDNYSTETTNNINANGRSFDGNLYIVDGLDITSSVRPGVINISPGPDSVQEVSIQTNTYAVEYGRASSIVTAVTTKSGTNTIHGSLSDYYTAQQLWARTEFTNKYAPFHSATYAATLGAPIVKNHTFFFGSISPLRALVTNSAQTSFEAPQFVNWAQANYPNSIGTSLLTQYPVTNATVSSTAKTAQDVLGSACGTAAFKNIPCNLPLIVNGNYSLSPYRNGTQWNARIDQYFKADRIYANYYQTILSTSTLSVRNGMNTGNHNVSRSGQINETHTFSSATINEASFGGLQIEGISNQSGPFHVPVISITGQGTGLGVGAPNQDFIQHNYHWRDVFSYIHGSHTLKFGTEGFEGDELTLFEQQYNQPTFNFTNLLGLVQDQPFSETNFLYNPVTGQPAFFNLGVATMTLGFFAQDEWKVRPHLTLSLGIRFDSYGNTHPSDALHSIISNYVLGSGSTLAEKVANGALKQSAHILNHIPTAWSPRVGVAWDPTGHGVWSVRGGFGIYHDFVTNGELSVPLRQNPPPFANPTFRSGTTLPPLFSLGTSDTFPFGYKVPALPPSTLDSHGGVVGYQFTIGATDPNLNSPVTYTYTIGVQRQLGRHFVVSSNYAGSQSRDLLEGGVNTITANNDVNRFAGDLIQNKNVLHRLVPSFGAINYTINGNRSSYNAFIATVNGRFGGSSFQASYTRSSVADYGLQYPDSTNVAQYEGPANFNVPNRFSMTESLDLPRLQKWNPVLRYWLGGWMLSGTVILQSGFPFTVLTTAAFNPTVDANGNVSGLKTGSGDYNADGYNYDFPNVPASGYSQGSSRHDYLTGLFPVSAFTAPALGTEGNEKRNQFHGPGFADWDLGLVKNILIRERVKLQLRFEFFNVLNHPNLQQVSGDLASASFGKSTSTFNPRYLQLGVKIQF